MIVVCSVPKSFFLKMATRGKERQSFLLFERGRLRFPTLRRDAGATDLISFCNFTMLKTAVFWLYKWERKTQ